MNSDLILETTDLVLITSEVRSRIHAKSFFALSGDMGAGKTTLVAEVLKFENVSVSSPTFALYNSYRAQGLDIIHVDLYRLDSQNQVDSAGFWDLFANSQSVIFTEWVERINLLDIPMDWSKWLIQIKVGSDLNRKYSLFKWV